MNSNKKIALVTGASSGMGRELAKVLAENGYDLVVVARREERLQELAEQLAEKYKTKTKIIVKDLSQSSAAREIFKELEKENINLDVLVNDAGSGVYGLFQETEIEKELNIINLNIIFLTQFTKMIVQRWLKQDRAGKILNLGSTGSFMAVPYNTVYSATKAYVLFFSDGLSKDLEGTGITVTTLCPGATKTEFAEVAHMPEKIRLNDFGLMSAEEVARIGYRALMKGKRVVVAGFHNKLMVFLMRLAPRSLILRISKYIMSEKK